MIGALAARHVRWLLAARDVLATALLTAFVVAIVGLLALHDATDRERAATAVLWSVTALAGLVAASRMLAAEEAGGGLRALLLAPIDRRDLFLSRALVTALVVLALGLAAWAAVAALFPGVGALRSAAPLPALAVGAAGLGLVGALAGWAALATRAGEVLGPVLAVPLAAPLIVACVHATGEALASGAMWGASLTFATGYVVAVGAIAYLVSGNVAEGA